MRHLSIRDIRADLSRLDELLAREGEIILTRHGKPIARILPIAPAHRPSHKELRASMPFQSVASEVLIREDRDAR